MDLYRGLAILLVLLFHATLALNYWVAGHHPIFGDISRIFGPYRMAGLVLLSGMLVDRSFRKGRTSYISGKLTHIAWPYLIWVLLTSIVMFGEVPPHIAIKSIGPLHPNLWYLWFLLAFYLLHLVTNRSKPVLVALFSFGLCMFVPDLLNLPKFTLLFGYFNLGIALSRNLNVIIPWLRKGSSFLWLILPAAHISMANLERNVHYYDPLVVPWVLCGIGLLIWLCLRLEQFKIFSVPLSYVGRNSLVFYVMHWPIMILLARSDAATEIHRSVILIPLLLVISISICIIFIELSKRSHLVGALFAAPKFRPRLTSKGQKSSDRQPESSEELDPKRTVLVDV